MVLTAAGGKIPKDLSWNAGKKSMGNVDAFLKSLQNFDKDNVPENCVAAVERVRFIPALQPPPAVACKLLWACTNTCCLGAVPLTLQAAACTS